MIRTLLICLILLLTGFCKLSAQSTQQLNEVVVKGKASLRAKGDTLEYDASKYKTKENAVVGDLLQKLPGVRVDRNGNIIAQGETVQKILVDGKEFFGNDPAIATRNLTADMVDKIQVLDRVSDQTAFTGVDDGNRVKTINIITKKDMKKGYFGNVSAGAGASNKYEAGTNINSFSGDQQLSFLYKANNVNKSGFSGAELMHLATSNPEMFSQLPDYATAELLKMKGVQSIGADPATIAQLTNPIGLNNMQYGGLNYNNNLGHQIELHGSYFFNRSTTTNQYDYHRYYQLPDSSWQQQENGNTKATNVNHRFNFSLDVPFNANNRLKISPSLFILQSNDANQRTYTAMNNNQDYLLNNGDQSRQMSLQSWQGGTDILFQHKFPQKGHTLSATISPSWMSTHNNTLNIAHNNIYNIKNPEADSVNQQLKGDNRSFSINNNIAYTVPLSTTHTLLLSETLYYANAHNEQNALNFNYNAHGYTINDPAYNDNLTSSILKSIPDIAVAAKYKHLTYNVGLGWQTTSQQGSSALKGYEIDHHYQALLPHFNARYQFSAANKLTLDYKTTVLLPSVAQLQPLPDLSNPLDIRQGNPDLQPAIRHSLQANWVFSNASTGNYTHISFGSNITDHQFTPYTVTDSSTGKQLTHPVNTNGNLNTNLSFEHFIRTNEDGAGLSLGMDLSHNNYPSWFNGIRQQNTQNSIGPDITYNFYPLSNLNLSAHINPAYNTNSASHQSYWWLNYDVSAVATLPWNMQAESELTCYTSSGLSKDYNTTNILWNASLTKNVGRNFSLKATATDILGQNKSIRRLVREGYTEDQRNNVLGQYFMVGFTYNLRANKKK
ncbi:outer membrane beta-barrel protein [Chitinophaga sp. 30R24]|uniref:outer membrane beta-barrel protein n=1 Tax=Chitinophaga sp. 30R24 TaxID=3248838 RepID=UPI003B8F366F